MDSRLQQQCDLLVQNTQDMHKLFKWDSAMLGCAAASVFAGRGMRVPADAMREAQAVLKENAGAFSEFRGMVRPVILAQMALSGQPQAFFERTRAIYHLLNRSKVFDNTYKLLAAVLLAAHSGGHDPQSLVDRTEEIYARMRADHRFLTSSDDMPFAAILALSGLSFERIAAQSEKAFALLRARFRHTAGNTLQSLSHVLAADERPVEAKCEKLIAVYDALKAGKCRFGTGYEFVTLGTLMMIDLSAQQIADRIIEADAYLKGQKGFGGFSMGSVQRRMFAAQTVQDVYAAGAGKDALLSSTIAIAVAQQVAMMALVVSTTAAGS